MAENHFIGAADQGGNFTAGINTDDHPGDLPTQYALVNYLNRIMRLLLRRFFYFDCTPAICLVSLQLLCDQRGEKPCMVAGYG